MKKIFKAFFLSWEGQRFFISNVLGVFLAWAHGVTLGQKVRFFGLPHFRISSKGKCRVGDECTFRSGSTSNLIGINRPCILSVREGATLTIGSSCGFSGTVIGVFDSVILGDGVRCGANTLITDSDWHMQDPRTGKSRPVVIHDNVWLGANVTVLKGVTIGENAVVGAGSVVTGDIPANAVAAGNPCKVLPQQRPSADLNVR